MLLEEDLTKYVICTFILHLLAIIIFLFIELDVKYKIRLTEGEIRSTNEYRVIYR